MTASKNNTQQSALLLHGFASTAQSYFLPSLATTLKESGYQVFCPSLPNSSEPECDRWIKQTHDLLGQETNIDLIVAHSLGGCLAMQLLSQQLITVNKLFMIASSFGPKSVGAMNTFLTPHFDLKAIQEQTKQIWAISSYDDPWTDHEYSALFVKQLNAIGIFMNGWGHFEVDELPDPIMKILST